MDEQKTDVTYKNRNGKHLKAYCSTKGNIVPLMTLCTTESCDLVLYHCRLISAFDGHKFSASIFVAIEPSPIILRATNRHAKITQQLGMQFQFDEQSKYYV